MPTLSTPRPIVIAAPAPAPAEPARDRVFDAPRAKPADFRFNAEVASVFDDMVGRSVPFYDEFQRMTVELAADFAEPGSSVYDLGCSTGTTLLALDAVVDPSVSLVGVDCAPEMLDKARAKCGAADTRRPIAFRHADLHKEQVVDDASVALMVLTLQFMRPLHRERVLRRVFDGLQHNGAFLLVEKITMEDSTLNRLFIDHYYGYKRGQGYSEMEISQKREALENVLIPYRLEENVDLLQEVGFRTVEPYFRWYNFVGLVAVK